MTTDRTYCRGRLCDRAQLCAIWIPNMRKLAASEGVDLVHLRIHAVDTFTQWGQSCREYEPLTARVPAPEVFNGA